MHCSHIQSPPNSDWVQRKVSIRTMLHKPWGSAIFCGVAGCRYTCAGCRRPIIAYNRGNHFSIDESGYFLLDAVGPSWASISLNFRRELAKTYVVTSHHSLSHSTGYRKRGFRTFPMRFSMGMRPQVSTSSTRPSKPVGTYKSLPVPWYLCLRESSQHLLLPPS